MKPPAKNAPLPNDFAIQILRVLKSGGVSRSELAQELDPPPCKETLRIHLEQLERLQLVVRDRTGPTDRWWIDGDAVLSMSDCLAKCAEGLTEADKAFVRGLSVRMGEILQRRKLFNSAERVRILKEIVQAPRDIHYIWNKMNETTPRHKILTTLRIFEASGLAVGVQKRTKDRRGFGQELEFRATRLGMEIAQVLRLEDASPEGSSSSDMLA